MDAMQWMNQYNTLKRDIVTKRQTGRPVGQIDQKNISAAISSLERDLKTMAQSPLEYELTAAEIARRHVIFDNLKKQLSLLVVSGSPLTGINNSSSNVDRSSQSSTGSAMFSELSLNPLQTQSSAGLLQRQQEVIKMQDDMIIEIGKGVDVLHGQAVRIGEEVQQQNKILDKLDTQVDSATDELRNEAKHAEQINRSTRMCSYYVCVVVEIIVIIVLLIFMFGLAH